MTLKKSRLKNSRGFRPGLTLLELIVVLTILVAVAGIIVPLLPNVIGLSYTATGSTNTVEVTRLVQHYQTVYQGYPNYLDNLAGTNAPIDYLSQLSGQMSFYTLTTNDVTALNNAGITYLATLYPTKAQLLNAGGTPTFSPYMPTTVPSSPNVVVGLGVVQLLEAAVETPPGIVRDDPNGNTYGDIYLVFGFGKQTPAIGRVTTDAPVQSSELAVNAPTNVYCRYGLVFRTARGTGPAGSPVSTPLTQAVFMGAVSFQTTGIMGSDGQLQNYYDNILKQQ